MVGEKGRELGSTEPTATSVRRGMRPPERRLYGGRVATVSYQNLNLRGKPPFSLCAYALTLQRGFSPAGESQRIGEIPAPIGRGAGRIRVDRGRIGKDPNLGR